MRAKERSGCDGDAEYERSVSMGTLRSAFDPEADFLDLAVDCPTVNALRRHAYC